MVLNNMCLYVLGVATITYPHITKMPISYHYNQQVPSFPHSSPNSLRKPYKSKEFIFNGHCLFTCIVSQHQVRSSNICLSPYHLFGNVSVSIHVERRLHLFFQLNRIIIYIICIPIKTSLSTSLLIYCWGTTLVTKSQSL